MTSVFLHTATFRSATEALDAGESVLVCGGRASGRTTVLREVSEHYALSGRSTLILRGTRGLDAPLASLRASDFGAQLPTTLDAAVAEAFSMLVEALEKGDQSVLVDDLDELDSVSLALLDRAMRTTGTPVLATADSQLRSLRKKRSKAFSMAARIDMPSLGFEESAELLRETLGGPVETSTIARMMTKSGGVPGLLISLARSALRDRRLVPRGGLWQGTSDLWNSGARHSITTLLSELKGRDRDALLILSLTGNVGLDVAQELVGRKQLERLEKLGRIGVHGAASDGHCLSVSVQPQLVAEYFRHESPTVQRLNVAEKIHERLGSGFTPAGYEIESPLSYPEPRAVIARISPATFSVLQERLRNWYVHAHREWIDSPSVSTAIPLLNVLVARGVDRREVIDVLTATRRLVDDATPSVQFVMWEARWHAWVDRDLATAITKLDHAKDTASLAEKETLDTFSEHLLLVGDATPARMLDATPAALPVPDPIDAPGHHYAEALQAVMAGQPHEALRSLETIAPVDDAEERTLSGSLYAESLLLSGAVIEALEFCLSRREEAIQDVDSTAICLFSHTLAKALIFMGRFHEAEGVLDDALSIGNPSFPHIPLHVGNLTMLAMVQGRLGRFDLAIPTQVRAEAYGLVHSFTLLGSPQWSRAYLDALRGEREGMAQLWACGEELRARGFVPAALGVWAFGLGAWTEEQLTQAETLNGEFCGDLFTPMMAYQRALSKGTAEDLDEVASLLETENRPFFAGASLYAASRRLPADGNHDVIDDRRMRAKRIADSLGVDLFDLTPGASMLSSMSPREREIATMVSQRFSNAEIADRLFLSVRTVESHVHRVLRKLDLTSRTNLVALWKKY